MKKLSARTVGWITSALAVPLTAILGGLLGVDRAPAQAILYCYQLEECAASEKGCNFTKVTKTCRIKCNDYVTVVNCNS